MSIIEIQEIIGPKDGPCILVLTGVHGNEPCGVFALKQLETIQLNKGKIIFVVANKKALSKNKRFIDKDLNRSFEEIDETNEGKIVSELQPLLDSADFLLDIHSSNTNDPYIICREKYLEIAAVLPAEKVVVGLEQFHKGSSDEYIAKQNKPGICIECGSHTDPLSVDVAKKAISNILQSYGMVSGSNEMRQQKVFKATSIYQSKKSFRPRKKFQDFELLEKNSLIGTDDREKIVADKSSIILFVQEQETAGKECFVICEN